MNKGNKEHKCKTGKLKQENWRYHAEGTLRSRVEHILEPARECSTDLVQSGQVTLPQPSGTAAASSRSASSCPSPGEQDTGCAGGAAGRWAENEFH